ncbi:MAG TPA: alpha/beta hydrolase [Acidimicrobiales bacterium]|jgi:acetyl esterase/lipase|nr:alpha/beta hydrolase [Acidimicrobiales bacterium]
MTTTPLDPELAHLADLDVGFGGDTFDLAGIRSGILELTQPPPPVDGVVADRQVIRSSPPLAVELFSPETPGPHPCLVWFHGGGYVIGNASLDAVRLQAWAARFDCVTVSTEYRLAPEDPFPAAHDDAMAALGWVVEHADERGIDPGRIVVAGASAGGGLAAGVVLAARDRGIPLAGQMLFYPMIDDRQQTASSQWNAPVWPPKANGFGWRAYLGDLYDGDVPPYAAPARATDLRGLPRSLLVIGGADGFLDETLAYASRLAHAGVPTDLRVYAGAPHGFDLMAPEARATQEALRAAEVWLEHTFAPPGA